MASTAQRTRNHRPEATVWLMRGSGRCGPGNARDLRRRVDEGLAALRARIRDRTPRSELEADAAALNAPCVIAGNERHTGLSGAGRVMTAACCTGCTLRGSGSGSGWCCWCGIVRWLCGGCLRLYSRYARIPRTLLETCSNMLDGRFVQSPPDSSST